MPQGSYLAVAKASPTLPLKGGRGDRGIGSTLVSVWELDAGQPLYEFEVKRSLLALLFSGDGNSLIAGEQDGSISEWDYRHGRELGRLNAHRFAVRELALSPDRRIMVSREADGSLALWSARSWQLIAFVRPASPLIANGLSFSPDARLLTALWQEEIRLLSVPGAGLQGSIKDKNPAGVAFSPDGKTLAWGGDSQAIRFWDLASNKERPVSQALKSGIHFVGFGANAKTLVTSGPKEPIRLWQATTGKESSRLPENPQLSPSREEGRVLALSSTGILAVAGQNIRLWDVAKGQELPALHPNQGVITALAFSGDGLFLAGAAPHRVLLWDMQKHTLVRSYGDKLETVLDLHFSADGKTLHARIAGVHDVLVSWDQRSGQQVRRVHVSPGLEFPQFAARAAALSPDGKLAALGGQEGEPPNSYRGELYLWDVVRGQSAGRLDSEESTVQAVAFSPDGRMLAAGHLSGALEVWEMATRQKRLELNGHRQSVACLAFSADGKLLASGSGDRTALVWDLFGLRASSCALRTSNFDLRTWSFGLRSSVPSFASKIEGRELPLDWLWHGMGSGNAREAYEAMCAFIATGSRLATVNCQEHLKPAPGVTVGVRDRMAGLVAQLDSHKSAAREAAAKELLEKYAEVATPRLERALWGQPSAEVRRRAGKLLAELERPRSPDILRRLRAVEVLEHIGTSEARHILESLATGEPTSRVTQEAKTSLERMAMTNHKGHEEQKP
jgi:WD40 repeat protein